MKLRRCEWCSRILPSKRVGYSSARIAATRFCDRKCSSNAGKARRLAAAAHDCETCKQPIKKSPTDSPSGFAKRRFCSQRCRAAAGYESITCAVCGIEFVAKKNRKATFCSAVCAGQSHRKRIKIGQIELTIYEAAQLAGVAVDTIRRRIRRGLAPTDVLRAPTDDRRAAVRTSRIRGPRG